jgi:hypothetical protein
MIRTFIIFGFALMFSATAWAANWNQPKVDTAGIFNGFSATFHCGIPTSIQSDIKPFQKNSDGSITLQLAHGHKGKCNEDKKGDKRAPYFERIELKSKKPLEPGVKYEVTMDAMLSGEDGKGIGRHYNAGTVLFRIGNEWNNYRLVWKRFDELIAGKKWALPYKTYPSKLMSEHHTFTWEFTIIKGKFEVDFSIGKSNLHFYVGLYRPGTEKKPNTTQSVTIKSISIVPSL